MARAGSTLAKNLEDAGLASDAAALPSLGFLKKLANAALSGLRFAAGFAGGASRVAGRCVDARFAGGAGALSSRGLKNDLIVFGGAFAARSSFASTGRGGAVLTFSSTSLINSDSSHLYALRILLRLLELNAATVLSSLNATFPQ